LPPQIERPAGLADAAWESLTACLERLERATRDNDASLVVGSAKELVEAMAKVVLQERGETVGSGVDYGEALTKAHRALDRQPGEGLAADPGVREIAQGAKMIAGQLRILRNQYGTGHGRAGAPQIPGELVRVSVDAALLWCRWAARRLEHYISGRPSSLAHNLRSDLFTQGELRRRLEDANLRAIEEADQQLLGVAVAQRAMRGTFVVREDGVDACAEVSDLGVWPPGYRKGLVQGLFLDQDGYVDVKPWGVKLAARVLAPHPGAKAVLDELRESILQADWSTRYANDDENRIEVSRTMQAAAGVLRSPEARVAWGSVAHLLEFSSGPPAEPAVP
jgi:hypothetical protein